MACMKFSDKAITAYFWTLPFASAFALNPFFSIPNFICLIIGLIYYFSCLLNNSLKLTGTLFIFLYWIYFTLITMGSKWGESTVNQYVLWTFSFLFLFIPIRNILVASIHSLELMHRLLNIVSYVLLISCFLGIVEFLLNNFIGININNYIPRGELVDYAPTSFLFIRSRSFMEESGHFSFFIECFAPIVLAYLSRKSKLYVFFFSIFVLFGLLSSFSAYGFLSLFVGLTIGFYSYIRNSKKRRVLIQRFVLLFLFFVILFSFSHLLDFLLSVITVKLDSDNTSYMDRSSRFEGISNFLSGFPLLIGYGSGSFSALKIDSIISFYGGVLLNSGLLGMLIYIFFLITQYKVITSIRDCRMKTGFLISFVITTFHYIFIDNIYVPWYWVMLSLAHVYSYNSLYKR